MGQDFLLHIYHTLPAPARSVAASWRGWQLKRWRFGPETDRLVQEALEREYWDDQTWLRWREGRMAQVLQTAAEKVPYYKTAWKDRRDRGDASLIEELGNWSVLEKSALRRDPKAFLVTGANPSRMHHLQTSGTSGMPLDVWWTRDTVLRWQALFEARLRQWHGVTREDRWACIAGQLVVPVRNSSPPFWVWNAPLRELYLSSYHLRPAWIRAYLEALRHYRIRYLWGYPSSIYALALGALEAGGPGVELAAIVTNAEPLYPEQRAVIEKAFRCPVRQTYGMTEIVATASECEKGLLHLWPEVGSIEVLPDDAGGVAGELVCTGLFNLEMPLVRYRVGDRGRLADPGLRCPCGRTLPILAEIEGRSDDVLFTRDGRRVGRLDPVFKADLPVLESQIVQETLLRVRVNYSPAPGFGPADERAIERRLRDRLGDVEIVFEPMEAIPRSTNGKFRAVICALPRDQHPS